MPRRTVVFEDEFFERLNDLVPEERSATGVPSRTDFLAYDIPPLMDLLAEDYERVTLPVAGSDLRVLVQSGRFVEGCHERLRRDASPAYPQRAEVILGERHRFGPDRARRPSLRVANHEVEAPRRHHGAEVVVLGARPSCLPVSPVGVTFAFEELAPTKVARHVQQHAQIEQIMQLGPAAIGTLEDDDGRCPGNEGHWYVRNDLAVPIVSVPVEGMPFGDAADA